jgi:hypothetical protein
LYATLADIETETKSLRQVLQKLDAGISTVDTSLLANARWIRSRIHYEPFILTDDGDLLASGHVLASFFGISLGCLSSFEAIRLTDLDEHLEKCCNHFNLEGNYKTLSPNWTRPDLEKRVSEVLRKGKLSCHINKVTSRLVRRTITRQVLNKRCGMKTNMDPWRIGRFIPLYSTKLGASRVH